MSRRGNGASRNLDAESGASGLSAGGAKNNVLPFRHRQSVIAPAQSPGSVTDPMTKFKLADGTPTPIWGNPSTQRQMLGLHLAMQGAVEKVSDAIWKVGGPKSGTPVHIVNKALGTCSDCDDMKKTKPSRRLNCAEHWAVNYTICRPVFNAPPVDDWGDSYDADELEKIGDVLRVLPERYTGTVYKGKQTRGGYSRFAKDYDDALRSEFKNFLLTARLATQEIHWPMPSPGEELRGRRPYPLGTMLFAGLLRARFQWSYRMTEGFLEFLQGVGWLVPPRVEDRFFADGRPRTKFYPDFKAMQHFNEDPSNSPHLCYFMRQMFEVLQPLSNGVYAMDMSGEGKNRYFDYLANQRGGKKGKRDGDEYFRANPVMDVDTMAYAGVVVTTQHVHERKAADTLIEMLLGAYCDGYMGAFSVALPPDWKALMDGGYNDNELREAVKKAGGTQYTPYSVVAVEKGKRGFALEMHHKFFSQPRKFNKVYRMRTKIECGFASVDRICGPSVSSKGFVTATNEILFKYCAADVRLIGIAMHCYDLEVPMFGVRISDVDAA